MSAVLVVRPSSLGDVVWALALVEDLARARPGTSIDWVAEEAFVALPAMSGGVRRVVPVALRRWKRAPLSPASWREAAAFRRSVAAERYDAILDLQEQIKGGVMARAARGVRHGFDRASIREPAATWFDDVHHAVARDLHFCQRCRRLAAAALGYESDGPPRWRWRLPPPSTDEPRRPFVVFAHATSRDDKRWPVACWSSLVEAALGAGFDVVLPSGTATEADLARRIAGERDGVHVPPRLTLDALAGRLSRASAVVGVDTGLTHLAAALGTPTLALFTVTDPALAGVAIAGPHARDLGGRGVVATVNDATAALGALLRAAPRC